MALQVCIIGLGRIGHGDAGAADAGRVCSHAAVVQSTAGLMLVGGVDIDPVKCRSFTAVRGVPAWEQLSEVPTDCRPALYVIAVDDGEDQYTLCREVLDRGARAIVCEKPFMRHVPADRVRALLVDCARAGVPVAVHHWMRWDPTIAAARVLLRQGGLGRLQQVRYVYAKGSYNSGSHAVDLLQYLLGPVRRVRASCCHELDGGRVNLDGQLYWDDLVVDLRSVDYRHRFLTECDLIGSRGRLILGDRLSCLLADGLGVWESHALPGSVLSPTVAMRRMYGQLLLCLAGELSTVECTGWDGFHAVRVIDALHGSWAGGGSVLQMEGLT